MKPDQQDSATTCHLWRRKSHSRSHQA